MKTITKLTATLTLFLLVAGLYSCNKQQNLQPEEKSAVPRKASSPTTKEQAYLNLFNSGPDIVYQWEPKKFKEDLSAIRFPMDAYSNEYMYYNKQVIRIGRGTVDFMVKDWDAWTRFKQNSAAYAEAADYFLLKGKPRFVETEMEKQLRIRTELTNILGPGDSFEFTDNIPANAPSFASVEEFRNSLKLLQFEEPTVDDITLVQRIVFGALMGININLKVSSNTPVAELIDVTSQNWGLQLIYFWTQTSFDHSTSGDITTVNIKGEMNYKIIFEGLGTILSLPKTFQIKYNNKTRVITYRTQLKGQDIFNNFQIWN